MKILPTALLAGLMLACGAHASAAPRFVYGPYKDLAMWAQQSHAITFAHNRKTQAAVADSRRNFGAGTLSWAFATGECGDEKWGLADARQVADANVNAFASAGVDYIISTGGQGGVFTCATDAGMDRFIARYHSKHLIGIDFDIEAGQTPAQVESLVARAVHAQKTHPALRWSFTIPTHAASDGSRRSLTPQGEQILEAVRKGGLRDYVVNLMVMDYGVPAKDSCVLRKGVCDMGRSAIQAVRNVHAKYGVPLNQIEVTAMIGVNDMAGNDFTLTDARVLADAVRTMKLAGLHFWSLDRDTPCAAPTTGASATCSSMDVKSGEFARALSRAAR